LTDLFADEAGACTEGEAGACIQTEAGACPK